MLPSRSSRRRRPLLAAAAAFLAATIAGGPLLATGALAQNLARVRFTLDWRFEGPAAPFALALDRGFFRDEGLEVTIDTGSGSRESIPRVASGAYDMGFGDVNSLVRFRDENPGAAQAVRAVMMVYDRPPFAIIGRRSRGITDDLASLKGKRFGAPGADAAFAQWPILRAVNRIDETGMAFENVGFPVRETMLVQGQVDAVFGFSISSAVNLRARGAAPDDLVTLLMSDHGVELYGNAVLVNPRFAAENGGTVARFLRALVRAYRETVKDPATAVEGVLKRNDTAHREVELERLRMNLAENVLTPWVRANGFGGIDRVRFERALNQIGLTLTYKNRPKAEDIFTDAFLPPSAERAIGP